MKINNITVVPRNNRPTVLGKTALELYYIKGGVYADPYQVCSVILVPDTVTSSTYHKTITNGDPERYLDYESSSTRYGNVASGVVSAVDMRWRNVVSGTQEHVSDPDATEFETVNYEGDVSSASGIFKIGEGHFAVVLQPNGLYISSEYSSETGFEFANSGTATQSASGVGKYYDIWVIVDNEGASPKAYINKVSLFNDTIMAMAEPLSFTSKNQLVQKYVNVGSNVKLKVKTEISLMDKNIPLDIRSIFSDSVIQSAEIKIRKYDENGGGWSQLQDWSDVDFITSSDTMLYGYTFSTVGRYDVQVKYPLMDETIYSDKWNLVCR